MDGEAMTEHACPLIQKEYTCGVPQLCTSGGMYLTMELKALIA